MTCTIFLTLIMGVFSQLNMYNFGGGGGGYLYGPGEPLQAGYDRRGGRYDCPDTSSSSSSALHTDSGTIYGHTSLSPKELADIKARSDASTREWLLKSAKSHLKSHVESTIRSRHEMIAKMEDHQELRYLIAEDARRFMYNLPDNALLNDKDEYIHNHIFYSFLGIATHVDLGKEGYKDDNYERYKNIYEAMDSRTIPNREWLYDLERVVRIADYNDGYIPFDKVFSKVFTPSDQLNFYFLKSKEGKEYFTKIKPRVLAFKVKTEEAKVSIGTMDNRGLRREILREAQDVFRQASQEYFTGRGHFNKDEGEIALTIAEGLLDLSTSLDLLTSFTPGVSWLKDLYEGFFGRSFITGEPLDYFSQSMAIVGAVTLGFGSKAGTAVKILGKFKGRRIISGLSENMMERGHKIWTQNPRKKWDEIQNAYHHFKKHGKEFPELPNAVRYVERTYDFIHSPPRGTLTVTRANGDTLFYHADSNIFAIKSPEGMPRTMYKPKEGMAYWKGEVNKIDNPIVEEIK